MLNKFEDFFLQISYQFFADMKSESPKVWISLFVTFSGTKLFAKVINSLQTSLRAGKELNSSSSS